MKQGEVGTVTVVAGGFGLRRRLSAMCIIPGAHLKKISDSFLRGPVTVQIGNAQVALGFGMASKVLVEVGEDAKP